MAVHLELRVDDQNRVQALLNGRDPLGPPVPLERLQRVLTAFHHTVRNPQALLEAPARATAAEDPGPLLFTALGGPALQEALQEALDADPKGPLLLHLDHTLEGLPWERATLPDGDLLATVYPMARWIDRAAAPLPSDQPLHQLVVLTADPLVDQGGNPRRIRLNFRTEIQGLHQALNEKPVALSARRIPPTREGLRIALRQGPAILHLAAHGDLDHQGPWLLLESPDGGPDPLPGRELARLAPRGYLRLVVLAACLTAAGDPTQRLARSLVEAGIPAVVGMQGGLPDALAPVFARHFYAALFQEGLSLAEALLQARQAMRDHARDRLQIRAMTTLQDLAALPVLYLARNANQALPLTRGEPQIDLDPPGRVALPEEIMTVPDPFLGREEHLHALARLYHQGSRVVTLIGAAGTGKTALAAAFARRFAWRWPHGVAGYSFAAFEDHLPSPLVVARGLLEAALGPEAAQELTRAEDLPRMLRKKNWHGLLVLDNYETILQALEAEDHHGPAHAIHRLVYLLADTGQELLLTSRQYPAGLPGEKVHAIPGLPVEEAANLFVHYSQRAKELLPAPQEDLARQVARVTEGHPLAIRLLAREFDLSPERPPDAFLADWDAELRQAKDPGLPEHHRSLLAALARTYRHLSPQAQRRARLLSPFTFPFLAEAAALAWGLADPQGTPDPKAALPALLDLHRRGLLEIALTRNDDRGNPRPWAFRLLPPVREALRAWLTPEETATVQRALAAYGLWLARLAYGTIHHDPALARLARDSMPALEAGLTALEAGPERLWHIRRTAWLKKAFGDYEGALELLQPHAGPPPPEGDRETLRAWSSLWYELADVYRVRGELDRALQLYQESLDIKDRLGDLQGRAATLGMMGQVLFEQGRREEGIRATLEGYLILQKLDIEPQGRKTLEEVLAAMRRQAGPEVFDPIWHELTQGRPLPEGL